MVEHNNTNLESCLNAKLKSIGRFIVIGLVMILGFSSCKTHNLFMEEKGDRNTEIVDLDTIFFYDSTYEYTIRKDDKLNISVWQQDQLSVGSLYGIYNSNVVYGKWLLVDMNGNIEAPKIGTINVLGLTVIELKDTLKTIIGQWVINPIVDVKVLNKTITVLGEVRDPGEIKVDKDNNSLVQAIARCKGLNFYAEKRYVKVIRQHGPHVIVANIDLTNPENYSKRNLQLRPGDVVIVPSIGYKTFDKRISVIVPFTTVATAAAILIGLF